MQMYAPPGVNAVTSATTGQPYAVAPGGAINALVQDVPDLLSRGFTFVRMPFTLAQSGTPVILPSSGSSNASGQITLTTALPYQPSGTVGLYLPAGVVTAGSQGTGAGVYQVVFSSTTVAQVQGTGITTANGAYTQDTTTVTLASVVVPGGSMGPNGMLRIGPQWSFPNNANAKSINVLLGGQGVAAWSDTTTLQESRDVRVRNRGSQASQVSTDWLSYGNGAVAAKLRNVDTSLNQAVTLTAALAVVTDYVILEGYTVEVLPG